MLRNTEKENKHPDYMLLGIFAVLLVFGIVILASVSSSYSEQKFGNVYYLLKHQIIFSILPGLILAILAFKIPLSFFKRAAPWALLANLLLLALVFLPQVGTKLGGAARWINIGAYSFQPSEILKLTFILYLASWLSNRFAGKIFNKKPPAFGQTFLAFVVAIGIIGLLLIFQPATSTLGIIVISAVMMYFLIDTPLWHSGLIILIGAGVLGALIMLTPYRFDRFKVFLNPGADTMNKGYQINQSLTAIGSGGISGLGLGLSMQKFGFLPQSISDSIFAIFAEETGFIGSMVLILLYFIFFWRSFRIGKLSQDKFSQLAAFGITFWISIQTFINIGSTLGIVPLTGVPLPFISYGGSAIIAELTGVGILLNISKNI